MACLVMLINLASAQNTITGKVFDKETKEPLFGVTIFIPNTQTEATTDSKGNFTLTSENKIDTIKISFIGYKTLSLLSAESFNFASAVVTSLWFRDARNYATLAI